MNKPRNSDARFVEVIRDSHSVRESLDKLGLRQSSGAYQFFHDRARRLGIDLSHFTGQAHLKGKSHTWSPAKPLADLLVNDGSPHGNLKARIIKAGLIPNQCSNPECQVAGEWLGKPITLHLDHINGDRLDDRIENIRFLCPNCHSQTPTYGMGTRSRKEHPTCPDCGAPVNRRPNRCLKCASKRKVRPTGVEPARPHAGTGLST